MTEHTKEPWAIGKPLPAPVALGYSPEQQAVSDYVERCKIFSGRQRVGICEREEDSRRVVAAVNACEGLTDAELSHGPVLPLHRHSHLASQRDDLLAALEASKAFIENYGMKTESILTMAAKYQSGIAVLAQIDSAIASARGDA